MCSHYQNVTDRERFVPRFQLEPPAGTVEDVWPGYAGTFIRRDLLADVGDDAVPEIEAQAGVFGLIPHWASDLKAARHTYNARSETAAQKPSFRDAYRRNQRCSVPVEGFYEPDWRSGRAVPTLLRAADGQPLSLTGLWSSWRAEGGQTIHSFTMLTINAERHPLMRQFHKPLDEKRMVVVLSEAGEQSWLQDLNRPIVDFMRPCPGEALVATSVPTTQPSAIER